MRERASDWHYGVAGVCERVSEWAYGVVREMRDKRCAGERMQSKGTTDRTK
jgi:hypothetical protein